jgi:hypothetical protein
MGVLVRSSPAGRLAATVALALTGLVGVAACGSGSTPARPAADCPTCAATIAQVKADTLASVAQRIYRQEVYGSPNGAAYARIAPLAGLSRGLETHDYALARRTILDQPVRHAVRVRVLSRAGKKLVDVGLGFVIAGAPHPLIAPDGRDLGRITVSIQDVIGFVKLVHRLTGTGVVVRGSLDQHVETSLPAALPVSLPKSGPTQIAGRTYTVSSFAGAGFAGERLRVWILAPGGRATTAPASR